MERRKNITRFAGSVAGAALVALTGLALVRERAGEGLRQLSYDLPFFFQPRRPVEDVALVILDRETQKRLGQGQGRREHAALLQQLTREGAQLVFYDIVFEDPQPEADAVFAQAISNHHGRVVLGGELRQSTAMFGEKPAALTLALKLPPSELLSAAQHWGLVQLQNFDARRVVRELFTGDSNQAAAVWVAAALAGATVTSAPEKRLAQRWVNHYGPPLQTFPQVTFQQALQLEARPTNFFFGKTVFIGGQPVELKRGCDRDTFATPYTRFGWDFAPGVEVLATEFVNLRDGEWLESVAEAKQRLMAGLFGLLCAVGLLRLRPWHAAWVALAAMMAVGCASMYVQIHQRLWWSWLVPVAVQTPLALVWSVGYQYAFASRKARQLRRAFAAYLSPEMAEQIAHSDVAVALGGKEVEATILFTDLEGFSTMVETLPPTEVSKLLIAYFNRTTGHILQRRGMISKYIGDSVMAIWGAPLATDDHAGPAVLAACGIIEAGRAEIAGRRLRTRIGIHTGLTLAGNLGSDFRFDYTAIGATTNLASRLENANQFLGTDILISEATRRRLDGQVRVRRLGRFLVKGIRQPVLIYEVLGTAESLPSAPDWLEPFERAVDLFAQRELEQAGALFRQVLDLRPQDGPALFYLAQLAALNSAPGSDEPWDGVLKLGA